MHMQYKSERLFLSWSNFLFILQNPCIALPTCVDFTFIPQKGKSFYSFITVILLAQARARRGAAPLPATNLAFLPTWLECRPPALDLGHEGGGPSKESGGSAGHPCRSSREEAATGDTFKQLSYIHKGVTAKPGFDWRILQ